MPGNPSSSQDSFEVGWIRGSSPRMTTEQVAGAVRNDGGLGALLPLHRLPADVAAAKAFRPLDAVDRLVSPALRFRDALARGADVHHAPAIGQNMSVLRDRAGVEDLDALDFGGLIEVVDAGAFCVIA